MNKLILKITDDYIYFYNLSNNKMIIEPIPKNIIKHTKIIDIENFITKLNNIIKKQKLNTLLLKTKIYIIIPSFYNKTDIFLLDYTFKILNYYNYEFIKEKELYNNLINKNTAIISLWDKLGEIAYKEKDKIVTEFFQSSEQINFKAENIIVINNTSNTKIKVENKNTIYMEPQKYYLIYKLKEKVMSN